MFRIACVSLFASLAVLPAQQVIAAAAYPSKPIKILIPFPPGAEQIS